MKLEIEEIPSPKSRRNALGLKETWLQDHIALLKPGQSFFVEDELAAEKPNFRVQAYNIARRLGMKINNLMETRPDGVKGRRIYRIS